VRCRRSRATRPRRIRLPARRESALRSRRGGRLPPRAAPPRRRAAHAPSRRSPASEPALPPVRAEGVAPGGRLTHPQAVERVHREPDAVIGDAVLFEVVRANLVGSTAAADLLAPRRAELGLLALLLHLQQPRPQNAERLVLVLELALLILARHHKTGRL